MGDFFQELRRRELGEVPVANSLRMARYLVEIGLFDDNFTGDFTDGHWPRVHRLPENWQWQDEQNEPEEPQPACQEAIKNLQTFVVQSEGKDCAICLIDFKKDEATKSMPCKHIFHEQCILTWLNQNNTCPFCRHRLPTAMN